MQALEFMTRISGEPSLARNIWRAAVDIGYYTDAIPRWTDPLAIFKAIQQECPVRLYLEVGSWLGGSAERALQAFPGLDLVVCVDTWLGAAEHWIDRSNPSHDLLWGHHLQPRLYEHFLANMIKTGRHQVVAPLRLPSTVAAEVLARHGFTADVIYIDGSHNYHDVRADCRSWWPMCGRFLVGDDWSDSRFGVAPAVLDFMREAQIDPRRLQIFAGNFWLIDKGPSADSSTDH